MPDSSAQDGSDLATARPEDLDELRSLLLAPEQNRLERLQERLDNPTLHANDVSRVLADAITLSRASDGSLTQALTPVVEEALTTSVRKSPHVIVDVIAPIMGPAIRQSIMQTVQGMVQSLNQTLEHSMSAKGLSWRVEAWKTGRPFAEVVLLHTLLYRVEQVFLIHRETGLLLQHVSADAAIVQDEQVVSGMLTAIQQFVRDSFGAGDADTLHQFQVGEYTVWIEQGTYGYLAGVIRGTPPIALRQIFQESLAHIHIRHRDDLICFDGDPAPFAPVHATLEACLRSQQEAPAQQKGLSAVWVLGAVLLMSLAVWGWFSYQASQRWTDFLLRAKEEPGLVVTHAESAFIGYRVEGLRDPLARDPELLLKESGFDPATVTASWVPYYALDLRLIVKRAHIMLHPPDTVTLSMTGDTLTASGSASVEWVREAGRLATLIPGVAVFDDKGLRVLSPEELIRRINDTVFHFSAGSSAIDVSEQKVLDSVIAALRDLDQAAAQSHQRVLLDVVGSTDSSGQAAINAQLGQARARSVMAALGGERFGAVTRITDGAGAPDAVKHRPAKRGPAEQRIVFLHAAVGPAESPEATRP